MPDEKENSPLRVLTRLRGGVPDLIDTPNQLEAAIRDLKTSSLPVAVDTERAQGYRYGNAAWVVQLRREDVGTFLIDSNALPDLRELNEVLQQTWIFHAAGQDLPSLTELGLVPPRIFDTEIAARLLGTRQFSLSSVCGEYLGLSLKKTHQSEDWSIRPLPNDWRRYAAMDVELLPTLEEKLRADLQRTERWQWAVEEFEHLLNHPIRSRENRWENLKGIRRLKTPPQWALARSLWESRERIAVDLDMAPGRILSNQAIVEAALANPSTRRKLQSLPEFRKPRTRQFADTWWDAVRRAQSLTAAELPGREALTNDEEIPPLARWKRAKPTAVPRLHAMRQLAADIAADLNLEADVILEPRVQRAVTWTPLSSAEELSWRLANARARQWQRELILERVSAAPTALRALRDGE